MLLKNVHFYSEKEENNKANAKKEHVDRRSQREEKHRRKVSDFCFEKFDSFLNIMDSFPLFILIVSFSYFQVSNAI